MTKRPPLLPEETFQRVTRVANVDGLSVLAVAGFLALAAASGRDFQGAAVGLLVAAAGAIELHGLGLLRAGHARGMNWLIASQPYLMAVLLAYCAWSLLFATVPPIPKEMAPLIAENARQLGLSSEDYLRAVAKIAYGTIAVVTVCYQGGLTLYYLQRKPAVTAAVETEI